jgi:hypothetical protein
MGIEIMEQSKKNISDYRGMIAFAILSIFSSIVIYSGDYAWYYLFSESPISGMIIYSIVTAAVVYTVNGIVQKFIAKRNEGFKKHVFSFAAYIVLLVLWSNAMINVCNDIGFSWFYSIFGTTRADVLSGIDTAIVLSMIGYIALYIFGDKELKASVKGGLTVIKGGKAETVETVETDTKSKTDTDDEIKTNSEDENSDTDETKVS